MSCEHKCLRFAPSNKLYKKWFMLDLDGMAADFYCLCQLNDLAFP